MAESDPIALWAKFVAQTGVNDARRAANLAKRSLEEQQRTDLLALVPVSDGLCIARVVDYDPFSRNCSVELAVSDSTSYEHALRSIACTVFNELPVDVFDVTVPSDVALGNDFWTLATEVGVLERIRWSRGDWQSDRVVQFVRDGLAPRPDIGFNPVRSHVPPGWRNNSADVLAGRLAAESRFAFVDLRASHLEQIAQEVASDPLLRYAVVADPSSDLAAVLGSKFEGCPIRRAVSCSETGATAGWAAVHAVSADLAWASVELSLFSRFRRSHAFVECGLTFLALVLQTLPVAKIYMTRIAPADDPISTAMNSVANVEAIRPDWAVRAGLAAPKVTWALSAAFVCATMTELSLGAERNSAIRFGDVARTVGQVESDAPALRH